ncbi:MAG TPA: hypothetical protein VHG28_18685 [Longimicrobiaceae bacterium]|nr:hypothetical protein [Longimicrobiaceae bacterium]
MGAIRRALADAVERTGLRPVARDVGITHPALLSIMEGTEPRPSTTRKLVEWFLRYDAAGGGDVDVETVRAALSLMLRHVPEERQADARRELVEALERISKAAGVPVPKWLREVGEP